MKETPLLEKVCGQSGRQRGWCERGDGVRSTAVTGDEGDGDDNTQEIPDLLRMPNRSHHPPLTNEPRTNDMLTFSFRDTVGPPFPIIL